MFTINEILTDLSGAGSSKDIQELVDWIDAKYGGAEFESPDDLSENAVLSEACKALGWQSVPQTGGIEFTWLKDGEIYDFE